MIYVAVGYISLLLMCDDWTLFHSFIKLYQFQLVFACDAIHSLNIIQKQQEKDDRDDNEDDAEVDVDCINSTWFVIVSPILTNEKNIPLYLWHLHKLKLWSQSGLGKEWVGSDWRVPGESLGSDWRVPGESPPTP